MTLFFATLTNIALLVSHELATVESVHNLYSNESADTQHQHSNGTLTSCTCTFISAEHLGDTHHNLHRYQS